MQTCGRITRLQFFWMTEVKSLPPSYQSFTFICTLSCSADADQWLSWTNIHKFGKGLVPQLLNHTYCTLSCTTLSHRKVCVTQTNTHTSIQMFIPTHPFLSQLTWLISPADLTRLTQTDTYINTLHRDILRMCRQGRDYRLLISRKLWCQGVTGV